MADTIKNNIKLAVKEEVTEGVYLAPTAATSFIQPLADGLELNPTKELIERNNLNGSIGKNMPRGGMRAVSGGINVEAKASGVAGQVPEYGPLMKSAFGSVRTVATTTTSKATGNTSTVLAIQDADISKFNVGDIILVKQTGAYHTSPIVSKTTGTGTATITLLVAHPSGAMSASVVIEKFTTYVPANSGHPSLSISKYIEDARLEQAAGCKVSGLSLSNFATGQLPSFQFKLEGLSFDSSLSAPAYTPSYDTALPPIVLSAYVYVDGVAVSVNEVSLSVENGLAFKTATSSANGKISSRVASRTLSGSFNPYKQSDSIANFTKFKNDTPFSMFLMAGVPTVTGEYKDVVGIYLPSCMLTEFSEADQDGLLQESLSFSANRGADGSTNEIYLTFI
jgi:hypothetical protein